jgi:hypothetical protein
VHDGLDSVASGLASVTVARTLRAYDRGDICRMLTGATVIPLAWIIGSFLAGTPETAYLSAPDHRPAPDHADGAQ